MNMMCLLLVRSRKKTKRIKPNQKNTRQSQFQWKQVGSRLPFRQRWLSRGTFLVAVVKLQNLFVSDFSVGSCTELMEVL